MKPLIIINKEEFMKGFNRHPSLLPYGVETLLKLETEIEEQGAQDEIVVEFNHRFYWFDFIHENEDGYYYRHLFSFNR